VPLFCPQGEQSLTVAGGPVGPFEPGKPISPGLPVSPFRPLAPMLP